MTAGHARRAAAVCAAALFSLSGLTGCSGRMWEMVSDAAAIFSEAKLGGRPADSTGSGYVSSEAEVTEKQDGSLTEQTIGDPVEETPGLSGFAFDQLDSAVQDVYAQLYTGISAEKASFTIRAKNTDDIKPALAAVMTDCPQFFWIDGTASMSGFRSLGIWRITLHFNIDVSQIDSVRSRIEAKAEEYLSSIPDGANEYDKVKLAYEYIINLTDYSLSSTQNQNIQSVFLNGSSVCAGYARAFQYLLQKAGIWCAYVEGKTSDSGEGHAWDLVRIGDVYTYVDPSWGDPTYGEDQTDAKRLDIIYDYLCLTTDEMTRAGHEPDDTYTLPDCTDRSYDYYKLNGCYQEGYHEDSVSKALWNAVDNAEDVVYFKFSDFESYSEAQQALFPSEDSGRESLINAPIRQRMEWDSASSMRYYYSCSDALWIIKVYW